MWFQHGAPDHHGKCVRTHLSVSFGQRWIGRGGPVAWFCFQRSPDFFLSEAFITVVNATPIKYEINLVARIVCATAAIQENPGVFVRVRRPIVRRLQ